MAKHAPRFVALTQDALSRVREVGVHEVRDLIASHAAIELVDVREDSEWQTGHLPQAIHLGKGIIERDIETQIPDLRSEIVLYCGGGYRSALAADNLQRMGYTNVRSMAGGFRAWREAGLPIEPNA